MGSAGGSDEITSVPQLEMHPFLPGAAVPGAPDLDSLLVQNSVVLPHWPQMSQQTATSVSAQLIR
jgi:hypothetical protein